jgi:3-oxoacyl-[acyl-carrier-protein] synthase I
VTDPRLRGPGQHATSQPGRTLIAVSAASAVTAAGADVEQTCTSIRAGISGLSEHAYYGCQGRDPEWDAETTLIAGSVRTVDPVLDGRARLTELLVPVLADLARRGRVKRQELEKTALLVALPAPDPAVSTWGLADHFVPELSRRAGFVCAETHLSQAGHAGVFELVARASELVAAGRVTSCIVAGVDSYLSSDRLALLDRGYRLKSPRNVDGFFPGEAAAALLLEPAERARARGVEPLGAFAKIGLGTEPETAHGDKPSSGVGLASAIRELEAGAASPWVLCDLNGESYRAFEWGVVLARLGERLGVKRLVHPAASLGDVGAATGAILAASALSAFARGHAPSNEALLFTSSDGPQRAAALATRV